MSALPLSGATPPAIPLTGRRRSGAAEERAQQTQDCLSRAASATDPRRRQDLLDRAVLLNMQEAKAIARRYYNRGIAADDLDQVAYLSLVAATRRFDPTAGHDFLAFARPTVRGEVKRHFRDRGWTVRPPRRIQDTQRMVTSAVAELSQSLGRSPTTHEIAEHLGVVEDDVVESLAAHDCFSPTSLDKPVHTDGEETALLDLVLTVDDDTAASDDRVVLREALRHLSERDRRVVALRFFGDLTQSEIADDIGLSQMQVSRILSRILGELRQRLHRDLADPADDLMAASGG